MHGSPTQRHMCAQKQGQAQEEKILVGRRKELVRKVREEDGDREDRIHERST